MLDLGFLLVLTAWSAGVGLFVLRRFGPPPEEPADALGLAIPIGLGVLALAALALGMVDELDAGRLESVFGAGAIVAVPCLIRFGFGAFRRKDKDDEGAGPERVDRVFLAVLAAAAVGTIVTALAPVTDGDALCYHLQVPKRFLERGAVFYDADLHETIYPLLTEMLYAVALAFRGPVACRLVQWLLGVVFALNVSALARPSLGRRAWWAGTIAVLVPAVSNGMTAPLNDVALAAYGTAALYAWSRFRDLPTLPAAALTGVLTGLAMGVKYPALVLAGLIGLGIAPKFTSRIMFRVTARSAGLPVAGSRRSRRLVGEVVERLTTEIAETEDEKKTRWQKWRTRRRLVHVIAFLGFAWGVGGIWYARAFVNTGNPVHPFFRSTFGGAGLDEVLGPEKRPMAVNPWNLLTALLPMTLEPDRFDSFSHQFGPVFLLFLPALIWEKPPRRVLALAGIGYGFLILCLTQRQSMRFLLIALGPMSVAVAWLASAWWDRRTRPGRALVAVLLLALGFESALAVARARHGLGVVVGAESAEHYLARREPTFVVGRWIGDHLPGSAWLVGQDHRGFYIPRDYTMELAHRRRTGLGLHGESAAEVVAELRAAGFTHVLLCPPVPESAVEFDPTLGRILSPWLASKTPIYREDLTDGDGVLRRYAIYPLTEDRVAWRAAEARR